MKRTFTRFLFIATMLVSSAWTMAGNWVAPTKPASGDPVSGDTVTFYNVNRDGYICSGKINALWNSSAILGETGLKFRLDAATDDTDGSDCWTITTASGGYAGKYFFAPTAASDTPHLFCDMSGDWQGCRRFLFEKQENGYYRISLVHTHSLYTEGCYIGSDGQDNDLYINVNPTEKAEACVDFAIYSDALNAAYAARVALYNALNQAEEAGVSTDAAAAVYNNADATAAELNAATNELLSAIASVDFDPEASEENPQDITGHLVNPTFDEDIAGWTTNDMTWIGSSYTGTNSEISCFCEKWTWNKNHTDAHYVYQEINLPKGHYRLEADALATCQSDGSITVTGVSLYAKTEKNYSVAVATANNSPQHYSIDFLSKGTTATTIGFACEATTTANWMAVDNFTLYYLGSAEDMSDAYFALNNAVNTAMSAYPEEELSYIDAQTAAKEAYAEALQAAQTTLETKNSEDTVYETAMTNLNDALATLKASVNDYKTLSSLIDKCATLTDELSENWSELTNEVETLSNEIVDGFSEQLWGSEEVAAVSERYNVYVAIKTNLLDYTLTKMEEYGDDEDLVEMIENKQTEYIEAWHNGTYTSTADVAVAREALEQMITEYVNSRLQDGQDITAMIENADCSSMTGWTKVIDKTPTCSEGVSEVYQGTFNIQQTIKNLPKGHYRLTVQAFQRTGWGLSGFDKKSEKVSLYLYANDNQVQCHHVGDFASAEGYYVDPSGSNAYPYDSYDGTYGYYPNSMTGAAAAFGAEDSVYRNTLDFYLLEQAKTDVKIGLRADSYDSGWWCLFDNFTLTFLGNNASDYADALRDLMAQIDATIEEDAITVECQTMVTENEQKANEAIENEDGNACIDALAALKSTLAFAQRTVEKTRQLTNDYSIIADYRMEGVTSSDTEFQNTLDELVAALNSNSIKDEAELEEWEEKLQSGFTAYVQHDGLETATEENPFDITPVIYNYDGQDLMTGEYNTNGWNSTGNFAANEYGTEFYNNSFSISQTIKGLAPGYYKLHVQAFYRQGWPGQNVDTCANYVDLYAGEAHTHLLNIYDCWQDESIAGETTKITVDTLGTVKYVPNSMGEAAGYFNAGLYKNTLVFKVEEGATETTIGMTKETTLTGDWTIYDNWSLEYVGSTEPGEISTDMAAAQFTSAPVRTEFFSVDGKRASRLTRGINIVRSTDAQGNIRISKVLVK